MSDTWVIGNGGIATAVAKRLSGQGHHVTMIARSSTSPSDDIVVARYEDVDSMLKQSVPAHVIHATGLLYDDQHQPEKNIQQLTREWFDQNISANLWLAVEVLQTLSRHMNRRSVVKYAVLSARVGSISDNRLGGWYSYRMSKAALNMLVKNLAIEWSRHHPEAIVYGYHPGTVATHLSAPFQKNVPPEKLFTPDQAARYLLDVLESVTIAHSGSLLDWQGKVVAC